MDSPGQIEALGGNGQRPVQLEETVEQARGLPTASVSISLPQHTRVN